MKRVIAIVAAAMTLAACNTTTTSDKNRDAVTFTNDIDIVYVESDDDEVYTITSNYLYNAMTIHHEGHDYVVIWLDGAPDHFHAEHSANCPCYNIY